MVKIVFAAHGNLSTGIMDAANMLFGGLNIIKTVPLQPGVAPETYDAEVEAALNEQDCGNGVLALVDIFGGTPGNTIYRLSHRLGINTRIVTGVNLPMVLSLLSEYSENASLDELADKAMKNGKDGVKFFGSNDNNGNN